MLEVIESFGEVLTPDAVLQARGQVVEYAGRTCYRSEHKQHATSAPDFIRRIIASGHESVIEHANATARVVGSRAMSHQLVRHRLVAYSQESQRYCDYAAQTETPTKTPTLKVICPPTLDIALGFYKKYRNKWYVIDGGGALHDRGLNPIQSAWLAAIDRAYTSYLGFRAHDIKPEDARYVLPNATATQVVMTCNLREWRHIFKERALNPHAQWEIRGVMLNILNHLTHVLPYAFTDLLADADPPSES